MARIYRAKVQSTSKARSGGCGGAERVLMMQVS